MADILLDVDHLSIGFPGVPHPVVDGISFQVQQSQTVGLVGESGSGKSLTALALLKLTPPQATLNGHIRWKGQEVLAMTEPSLRQLRGRQMGLIFQNPLSALNPVYTIGEQLVETLRFHHGMSKPEAIERAIELLNQVQIPNPRSRLSDYPHQFSLGMCQRAVIAMTLAMKPTLLIADEPTASLDVTVQAQILSLLSGLKATENLSMLMISHDMGVIAQTCDWVLVMYLGQLVEEGPPEQLFHDPKHPYTKALIDAIPGLGKASKLGLKPVDHGPPTYTGCRFYSRCPYAMPKCLTDAPPETVVGDQHRVRCWLY